VSRSVDRRSFLTGSSTAMFCALGGGGMLGSRKDVVALDARARTAKAPKAAVRRDPVDAYRFQTPSPQAGGQVREYWVQAKSLKWDIAPTGRDDWMNMPIPSKAKRTFRAFAYQPFAPGFVNPLGPATIPGPTLEAEVGDVIVAHVRNGDEHFGQAITMHPHGVRYNPDYDGVYLGDYTRVGGFLAPGEEFTYTWEAVPGSVGVWPYHDHGPNHLVNTARGLFGSIIVREPGALKPDVETFLFFHSFPPNITGLAVNFEVTNGHTAAGNTPIVRAKVGQDVAWYVFGGDSMFHTFHVHGHRWKDSSGANVDNPSLGPLNSVTARWTEDNPGRWLYHCHVAPHQMGMAGWYFVDE
jgi:FtsP/CotA-like multicopper oxidase with cupredoxin domain